MKATEENISYENERNLWVAIKGLLPMGKNYFMKTKKI